MAAEVDQSELFDEAELETEPILEPIEEVIRKLHVSLTFTVYHNLIIPVVAGSFQPSIFSLNEF